MMVALMPDVGSGVECVEGGSDDGIVVSVGEMIAEVPVPVLPSADVVAVMPDDSPPVEGGVVTSERETEEGGSASEGVCEGVVASVVTSDASAAVVSPAAVVVVGTEHSRYS
jgi:hypothetical protein